ncbi:uncharacterized protein NECHADRAFT_85458 [Fusarium vanettenii 77-13-4]|uniref:Uncharacterized protein n=1 Tax=Fusarium vanettenii (strain ATCC MYA-4622 / CBS 123669 / FGSC 9596 / NRRL 45880 / 77-13-4) TaxID=660122 RepID=C7ZNP1_FUSV7|nr:uncharacterized protein NECHADRAFT_85458 [Fusarium vanettenii 77-13-4]EEU34211.1 predicted protein [Fusarium vanettenii 77-13-4]
MKSSSIFGFVVLATKPMVNPTQKQQDSRIDSHFYVSSGNDSNHFSGRLTFNSIYLSFLSSRSAASRSISSQKASSPATNNKDTCRLTNESITVHVPPAGACHPDNEFPKREIQGVKNSENLA